MNSETKSAIDSILASLPAAPRDVCYTEAFSVWQSERIEHGGCYRLGTDESDRFDRCHDASYDGADGSTHAEHIADVQDFGDQLFEEASSALWRLDLEPSEDAQVTEALETKQEAFDAACEALEAWHKSNGSLHKQVG